MRTKSIAFFALILAMLLGIFVGSLGTARNPTDSASQIEETDTKGEAPKYILKGHRGKLAVFINGKTSPEIVFDVFLNNLPDIDKFKLTDGIPARDYKELMRLIEDYTS